MRYLVIGLLLALALTGGILAVSDHGALLDDVYAPDVH
jgi:hypothetical protein